MSSNPRTEGSQGVAEVRIGGVTARFNEDGTLYIYQPDSNRLLSPELAGDLVDWLVLNYGPMQTAADGEWRAPELAEDLTDWLVAVTRLASDTGARTSLEEVEAEFLAETREEFGPEVQAPASPAEVGAAEELTVLNQDMGVYDKKPPAKPAARRRRPPHRTAG